MMLTYSRQLPIIAQPKVLVSSTSPTSCVMFISLWLAKRMSIDGMKQQGTAFSKTTI